MTGDLARALLADLDPLLDVLADRIAERIAARLEAGASAQDDWLSLPDAAAYLGLHRDTLRKRAKAGLVPFEQDGDRCRMYFRRSDLDAWRRAGGGPAWLTSLAKVASTRLPRP